MKSSWKKQRLTTKRRNIRLTRWKNRVIRKYGLVDLAIAFTRATKRLRKSFGAMAQAINSITPIKFQSMSKLRGE
ncbi:hypothetical protein [Lactococcus lactis]|uniref:hypothetical protein n=1 Tax=Lactococcus lactis TaxID=1358 RepID=UPI0023A9E9BE|nr:hypothetical protein [Lactococcus lactis]WEA54635.1 hypothetical protein PWP91_10175 [Lactococcus lactis]